MSTYDEQARALVLAGGLLVELARDESLPIGLRQKAVKIARHFPTVGEILLQSKIARHASPSLFSMPAPSHEEQLSWMRDCTEGPLTFEIHLDWPEERASSISWGSAPDQDRIELRRASRSASCGSSRASAGSSE